MRHTLEAIFQVMRLVVNYRKGQKQLERNVLHLKSTLATPPIYNRAYSEMLSTAFPGNPVCTRKPSSLLFVQPDRKFLEESTKLEGTYVLTIFGNKSMRKITRSQNLNQNSLLYILLKLFLNSSSLRHAERAKLWIIEKFIRKFIFWTKFFGQNIVKNRKVSAKDWMQLTLHIPSP